MADQKELKKRLKVLMNRPENQVCSDCTERQPRWASLIVPPPGAPPGSLAIGAFCCLECSGSHRRLGVHITFVRSINLDSWKEKEVLAMENGGNAKVNTIFEAHLNGSKPNNHADLQTRERYIRDKYERRKFYNAGAFATYAEQASRQPPPQQEFGNFATFPSPEEMQVGPPSDAARQRMEKKAAKGATSSIGHGSGEPKKTGKKKRSKSMDKAATTTDLLDLFGEAPAPAASPSKGQQSRRSSGHHSGSGNRKTPGRKKSGDLMGFLEGNNANSSSSSNRPSGNKTAVSDPFASHKESSESATADDFFKNAAQQIPPKRASMGSQDIMDLYKTTGYGQQQGWNNMGGMNMMQQMNPNQMNQMNAMMQQMSLQQQQQMMYQQQMMMMQQQQQMAMQQQQQQQQNYANWNNANPNAAAGMMFQPMNSQQRRGPATTSDGRRSSGLASMSSSRTIEPDADPFAGLGSKGFR